VACQASLEAEERMNDKIKDGTGGVTCRHCRQFIRRCRCGANYGAVHWVTRGLAGSRWCTSTQTHEPGYLLVGAAGEVPHGE
jgi:hypothetical protein